jgi:ketol-acid reductoisomerase
MMIDWANDDVNLLTLGGQLLYQLLRKTAPTASPILEQEYFDNGVLMIAW